MPTDENATITWSPTAGATAYDLVIYSDESLQNIVCTYHFDASGNLISITPHAKSVFQTATEPVFSHTIENLSSGTAYYYTMTAYNASNDVINSEQGEFTTTGVTTGIVSPVSERSQIVGYYSILGQKLPKEPESGVYIIVYDNGKAEKVAR
ncbi:hypothetical protein FACS18945_0320 [Bacteroidia bacterium]|nr:hypothetical protein FACS18945_0320 [Bacteroidia bacterium]